uniref:Uncharacterized protein n=1 Tax=Anguilla anguilla TaxID=7936 RepID=A0A0E9USD2_ANGAN
MSISGIYRSVSILASIKSSCSISCTQLSFTFCMQPCPRYLDNWNIPVFHNLGGNTRLMNKFPNALYTKIH